MAKHISSQVNMVKHNSTTWLPTYFSYHMGFFPFFKLNRMNQGHLKLLSRLFTNKSFQSQCACGETLKHLDLEWHDNSFPHNSWSFDHQRRQQALWIQEVSSKLL